MKEIKDVNLIIDKYNSESLCKKIKGKDSYMCCNFPLKIEQPIIDYIECNFNILDSDYYSVTFTYKTDK